MTLKVTKMTLSYKNDFECYKNDFESYKNDYASLKVMYVTESYACEVMHVT